MPEIQLTVSETKLVLVSPLSLVATEVNYDTCKFTFGVEWAGYVKTAVFYSNIHADPVAILLDEAGACTIPWEAMQDPGILYIGVFGIKGNIEIPTNMISLRLIQGAAGNNAPPPPSLDIYAQILNKIAEIKTEEDGFVQAESGRISSENARVVAEGLRATAETDRVSAENERVTAEEARVVAESTRQAEVITARGTYGTLDERLDANDTEVDGINAELADIANINKNTIALFGDSITAGNAVNTSTPYYNGIGGYFTWTNVLLNHAFNVVKYAGVGGNTTVQMLARVQTDIINNNPKPRFCLVLGGTNDCLQDIPASTIISNLTSIYTALINAGIIVIACTITPATTINGTVSRRNAMIAVNRWIKKLPQIYKDVIVCDWVPDFIDQTTGNPKTNYTGDGTHPSYLGAYYLGNKLYTVLKDKIQINDMLCNSAFDSASLLGNPLMVGDNAGLATGYTAQLAGTPTYTVSKIARTDNLGEWQQIQITSNGGVFLNKTLYDLTFPGKQVYLQFEFESDDDWSVTTSRIHAELDVYDTNWSGLANAYDLKYYPADGTYDFKNPRKGVLKTPIFTIPSGGIRITAGANFTGVGTIRIGRMELLYV